VTITNGTLRVLHADLALIQARGRFEYTYLGVPVCGAWDAQKYSLLGRLLDYLDEPAFEIFGGTLTLTSSSDAFIAVVGDATISLDGPTFPTEHTWVLPARSVLSVTSTGAEPVYLGVAGLLVERTLGSASTDIVSRLGPKQIRPKDELKYEYISKEDSLGRFAHIRQDNPALLRFIPGPHSDNLRDSKCQVTLQARSGMRLSEVVPFKIERGSEHSLLESYPTLQGAIQMQSDHQLIVLGPDSGVTDGYPVLGVVITADIPLISRFSVGGSVSLHSCTIDEAIDAFNAQDSAAQNSLVKIDRL
jgi:allophanate hydrolase subunit 2